MMRSVASCVLLALALSACTLDTSEIRAMADRPADERADVGPVDAGAGDDVAPDAVQLVDAGDRVDVAPDLAADERTDVAPVDASCPAVCPDLYRCTDGPLCCREICGGDCSSCGAGDHCTAIAGGCVVCCAP